MQSKTIKENLAHHKHKSIDRNDNLRNRITASGMYNNYMCYCNLIVFNQGCFETCGETLPIAAATATTDRPIPPLVSEISNPVIAKSVHVVVEI